MRRRANGLACQLPVSTCHLHAELMPQSRATLSTFYLAATGSPSRQSRPLVSRPDARTKTALLVSPRLRPRHCQGVGPFNSIIHQPLSQSTIHNPPAAKCNSARHSQSPIVNQAFSITRHTWATISPHPARSEKQQQLPATVGGNSLGVLSRRRGSTEFSREKNS